MHYNYVQLTLMHVVAAKQPQLLLRIQLSGLM